MYPLFFVKLKFMNKIVAIVGPTATGKTDLAVALCKKFNGEIISVDSRQAYKEMNIGTGKTITSSIPKLSATMLRSNVANGSRIQSHLDDLVLPSERLNAYDYSLLAQQKIKEIWSRKNLPFLVGGTGFYMDVILGRRILSGVSADPELRGELENLSKEQLIKRLDMLDPQKLKTMDIHNGYRLIRAIEIASKIYRARHPKPIRPEAHGSRRLVSGSGSRNEFRMTEKADPESDLGLKVSGDIFVMGLTADNTCLYERADERVDNMVKGGLIGEVSNLVKKYGWEAPGLNTLGYREFRPYLEGSIQLDEAVQKLKFNTHAYIRRQKTYFKKYFNDAQWFDISQEGFGEQAAGKVELFLR